MPPPPQTLALPRAASLSSLVGDWAWGEILLELALIGLLSLLAFGLLRRFNQFVMRVFRGRGRWRAGVLRVAPMVRFAIFAMLAVIVGSILFELSTPVLLISLVALSIALGLGSVELVRNVLSGAVIGLQRPFRVSDHVQLDELQGDVLRIGIRSTSLRAADGSIVHVPNHRFVAGVVVNSSLPAVGSPTRVTIPLPVGVDLALAKDLAYRAACVARYASPRRAPRVRVEHNRALIATDAEPPLVCEILVYAFSPRYEDALRGEVIELVNEGLAAAQRQRTHAESDAALARLELATATTEAGDDAPRK